MMTLRRAKIMPTLGPSSWDEDKIEALVHAGAAGFRLNFSHGDGPRHVQTMQNIRKVAAKLNRHIPIMQDLQGPKIRIGVMAEPVQLNVGDLFILDSDKTPGTASRVELPHPDIIESVREGDVVSVNDGAIRLKIEKKHADRLETRVELGGVISSRKGVNVPGRELPLKTLTEKDLNDLKLGLEQKVDWIAISFVQKAQDVRDARELIGDRAWIMTKIETQAAISNLEEIVKETDAIMIARGDLGVELPTEDVPPLQRRMIELCRQYGKLVVVATQMLESMIQNPMPTRAEASDVANAAFAGADCLMLSAESASGKYPIEAVATMARIAAKAEQTKDWTPSVNVFAPQEETGMNVQDSICHAASLMATNLNAGCIAGFTATGKTIKRLLRWRPTVPVVCLTPDEVVARRLCLAWGVYPVVAPQVNGTDDMVEKALEAVKKSGLVEAGKPVVITAGVPFGASGNTNLIRVVEAI